MSARYTYTSNYNSRRIMMDELEAQEPNGMATFWEAFMKLEDDESLRLGFPNKLEASRFKRAFSGYKTKQMRKNAEYRELLGDFILDYTIEPGKKGEPKDILVIKRNYEGKKSTTWRHVKILGEGAEE